MFLNQEMISDSIFEQLSPEMSYLVSKGKILWCFQASYSLKDLFSKFELTQSQIKNTQAKDSISIGSTN